MTNKRLEWSGKASRRGLEPRKGNGRVECSILSRTEPEKFRLNQPAPSGKAKYSWETDSEQVP